MATSVKTRTPVGAELPSVDGDPGRARCSRKALANEGTVIRDDLASLGEDTTTYAQRDQMDISEDRCRRRDIRDRTVSCRDRTGVSLDAAGWDRIEASRDEIDGRRTIHSQAIYDLRLLGAFGASSLVVFRSSLKMKKRTKE